MPRVLGRLVTLGLLLAGLPAATLARGRADTIQGFTSSVRYTDPTSGDVMPAMIDCEVRVRVEAEDGSASELQARVVSAEAEQPFGAVTPRSAPVTEAGGECIWSSDCWTVTDGSTVPAASFELTVTPGGRIYVRTTDPAEPLACPNA